MIMDTQPQGAQAQGENVFTDMGSAEACNASFLAMAAGSGGRFRVLADKVYMSNTVAAGTDGTNTNTAIRAGFKVKMNHKFLKPIQVILKANSSTPTVASLSNCNIFLLAHTGNSGGVGTLVGAGRAYYKD